MSVNQNSDRHAYLVMAHTEFAVLVKLVEALDHEANDIFVHIDSKATQVDHELLRSAVRKSTVRFAARMDVAWGTYSEIACELALLKLAHSVGGYSYYHLLSGMDLPLRPQTEIHEYFRERRGSEFIGYFSPRHWEWSRVRIAQYHWVHQWRPRSEGTVGDRVLDLVESVSARVQRRGSVDRLRKQQLEVRSGDQWFSVTEQMVAWVLGQQAFIRRRFGFSLCGSEVFLQTLAAASPFAANVTGCSLREVVWEEEGSAHPHVWTMEDLPRLRNSENLFARKFDSRVDAQIIDAVLYELASSSS